MIARFINVGIATWILVAAAAFHPSTPLFIVMLVVAFGTYAAEAAGFYRNRYRLWTFGLGALLVLGTALLPTHSRTLFWNNFIFGAALSVLSLFRSRTKMGRELWVPWSRNPESTVDYVDTVRRRDTPVRETP